MGWGCAVQLQRAREARLARFGSEQAREAAQKLADDAAAAGLTEREPEPAPLRRRPAGGSGSLASLNSGGGGGGGGAGGGVCRAVEPSL